MNLAESGLLTSDAENSVPTVDSSGTSGSCDNATPSTSNRVSPTDESFVDIEVKQAKSKQGIEGKSNKTPKKTR